MVGYSRDGREGVYRMGVSREERAAYCGVDSLGNWSYGFLGCFLLF